MILQLWHTCCLVWRWFRAASCCARSSARAARRACRLFIGSASSSAPDPPSCSIKATGVSSLWQCFGMTSSDARQKWGNV